MKLVDFLLFTQKKVYKTQEAYINVKLSYHMWILKNG